LVGDCVGNFRTIVPGATAPEARETVENATAIGGDVVAAIRSADEPRVLLELAVRRERHPVGFERLPVQVREISNDFLLFRRHGARPDCKGGARLEHSEVQANHSIPTTSANQHLTPRLGRQHFVSPFHTRLHTRSSAARSGFTARPIAARTAVARPVPTTRILCTSFGRSTLISPRGVIR